MPDKSDKAFQEELPRTPKERLEKAIALGAKDVKRNPDLYGAVLDGILQDIQMLPPAERESYKGRLSASGYEINGSNDKQKRR